MYISFIHVILIATANISSLVLRNMPLVSGRIISTMVVRLTREINIATTLGLDDLAVQCRNELAIALDRFQIFLTHYSQSQYPIFFLLSSPFLLYFLPPFLFLFSFILIIVMYSDLQSTWAKDNLVLRDYVLHAASGEFLYPLIQNNSISICNELVDRRMTS